MAETDTTDQTLSNHQKPRWWRNIRAYLSTELWAAAAALIISLAAVVWLAWGMSFNEGDLGLELFRVLMIVTFTILPAVMYYVFIATTKANLFQEYVSNLGRLGLLRPHKINEEDPIVIRNQQYLDHMRVDSYLVRFEGLYGSVGPELEHKLITATNTDIDKDDPSVVVARSSTDTYTRQPAGPGTRMHKLSPRQERRSGVKIFSFATAIPVFLASSLIGLGWVQFIPPLAVESEPGVPGGIITLASLHPDLPYNRLPALFAFLGAYFYALQMIYRRFMTNDLKASIFTSLSTRVVSAVIAACVLQAALVQSSGGDPTPILPDELLLATAFVVGSFPPVIWRLLRNVMRPITLLKGITPGFHSDLPLNRLDGLTIWHQTRLEEEDIENVYNMADTHILSLMLNTKIPANRIIGWVDQAILLSCANAVPNPDTNGAPKDALTIVDVLGQHGIRTASALVDLAAAQDKLEQQWASTIGATLLQTLAQSVYSYPNLELIMNWKHEQGKVRSDVVSGEAIAAPGRGTAISEATS